MKAFHDAKDGTANKDAEISFKVLFTSRDEMPLFEIIEKEVSFLENTVGCQSIPAAKDHKCDTISDCSFHIYYYITRGNGMCSLWSLKVFNNTVCCNAVQFLEEGNFSINAANEENPEICVVKALDRENVDIHYLEITATNYKTPPPPGIPVPNAIPLELTVQVYV